MFLGAVAADDGQGRRRRKLVPRYKAIRVGGGADGGVPGRRQRRAKLALDQRQTRHEGALSQQPAIAKDGVSVGKARTLLAKAADLETVELDGMAGGRRLDGHLGGGQGLASGLCGGVSRFRTPRCR